MNRSIFWLFLLLTPLAALPQAKPAAVTAVAPDDRAPLTVRQPDIDKLASLRQDRSYQYDRDAQPPTSPWARFWDWISRKINDLLQSKAYQYVGQYVVLAIIVGLVIWLLIKAQVLNALFPGRAKGLPLDYESITENIHEISFSERIDEAIANRNYRLAVRLLYLQTLKRLTDAGQIAWTPDKTNRQYVYELTNSSLRPDFDNLTTQFEYVWYGNGSVDETHFSQLREQFQNFRVNGRV